MAITLKSDPEKGWQVMALFDVDLVLIEQAKKHGVQCTQTTPGNFVVKNGLQTFGVVKVKGTALTLAQQKALGPQSKLGFKANFESALKNGIAASPLQEKEKAPIHPDEEVEEGDSFLGEVKPKSEPINLGSFLKQKLAQSEKAKIVSDAIELANATEVYQPVQGTSPGSVYYVFAMFPGMNLAARIKGTKLSVRAEGSNVINYGQILTIDFKMDKSVQGGSTHYSAHYSINEGTGLIVKTLGAIVGSLGFGQALKVADLKLFVNKGAA